MTTRSRIVMGVILAVAVVMLGYAFTLSRDESAPIVRDTTIVDTFPRPGARVLRQNTIYVELAVPHEGRLTLDGQPIEAKSIQTGNAIRLYYEPPSLRPGSHRVSVTYWHPNNPSATRNYSWAFEVS